MGQGGIEGVRAEIARAERKVRREKVVDPPKGDPMTIDGEKVPPGVWTPGKDGLPPGCPVKPLGREGNWLHVVDAKGQLISLKPSDMGQNQISALFHHRQNYLYWAWPRWSASKGDAPAKVEAWRAEKVREALYAAAGPLPLFSASNHVRGRGAWREANGEILYHSGDALWRRSSTAKGGLEEAPTGLIGRDFYELLPAIPAPWPQPVKSADNPAREIYKGLLSWHWERPDVDPVLMLGFIGAAMLGGALDWRSSVDVTGDKAVGKSSLLDYLRAIMGDGLVSGEDVTAAGITSHLRHDTLPVLLDELEAEADSRRSTEIVKLMKIAASGGRKLRGGSDQVGHEFTLRASFLFSSINPPPLRPEDVSRMAILRLRPLKDHPKRHKNAPTVDAERTGPMLLRVMMDEWSRFPATLEAYADVLREAGHPDRGQKTFGTLLACADLMLGPDIAHELGLPMVDDLAEWGERLATSRMAEYEDNAENWRACLQHLLTSRVEAWRGGVRHTVGQLIDAWREQCVRGEGDLKLEMVNDQLAQAGLKLMSDHRIDDDPMGFVLAIPNESQIVAQLYRDTRWVGTAGASVWKSALRQGPASVIVADKSLNKVRINGVQVRCTLVKMRAFEGLNGG